MRFLAEEEAGLGLVLAIGIVPGVAKAMFFVDGTENEVEGCGGIEDESVSAHTGGEPDEGQSKEVQRVAGPAERAGERSIEGRALGFGFGRDRLITGEVSVEGVESGDAGETNLTSGLEESDEADAAQKLSEGGHGFVHAPERLVSIGLTEDVPGKPAECGGALEIEEKAVVGVAVFLAEQAGGGLFRGTTGEGGMKSSKGSGCEDDFPDWSHAVRGLISKRPSHVD